MTDPTRQRNQPALTTSSGLIWLIMGGLLAAIAVGVLIPLFGAPPTGVAVGAAIVVAALYLGMLFVRFATRPRRRRLVLLATGMIAIAAVALAAVLVVAAASST